MYLIQIKKSYKKDSRTRKTNYCVLRTFGCKREYKYYRDNLVLQLQTYQQLGKLTLITYESTENKIE